MNRRTTEQWHTLFAQYHESGLRQVNFCREQRICPKYFSLRRRQLGDRTTVTTKPAFIPLSVLPPLAGLAIEVQFDNSLRVFLPAAISPQWLAALLAQLRT